MSSSQPHFATTARSPGVDFWKALSIVGVVWIHCSFLLPHSPAYLDWLSPLFEFCVPVFILYWSYFFERSIQKNGWNFRMSAHRAKGLLIRFFIWSLIYWLIKADFHSSPAQQISKYWSGYGWPGQYFFVVLIQLTFAFPLIRWMALKIPAWLNLSITFVVLAAMNQWLSPAGILVKIGDRPFFYWLPYVFAGIHLAQPGFKIPKIHFAVALCTIALIPLEIHFSTTQMLRIGPYFLSSIALASFLICMNGLNSEGPRFLHNPWVKKASTYLSKNSMAIFCLNPIFLIGSKWLFDGVRPIEGFGVAIWGPILSTSIALLGSLILAAVLEKMRFGFLIQNN